MLRERRQSKEISRSIINMTLLLVLIAAVFVVIVFIDEVNFRFKTMDPRKWIGIETIELTPDIKKQYDLPSSSGLFVSRTFVGSPAQIAGIREGDVIQRWNGTSLINPEQFQYLIQTADITDRITFTIDRQGKQVLVYGQVGLRPGGT